MSEVITRLDAASAEAKADHLRSGSLPHSLVIHTALLLVGIYVLVDAARDSAPNGVFTYVLLFGLTLVTGELPLQVLLRRDLAALLQPRPILDATLLGIFVLRPIYLLANAGDLFQVSPTLARWSGSTSLDGYMEMPLALAAVCIVITHATIGIGAREAADTQVVDPMRKTRKVNIRVVQAVLVLMVVGTAGWVVYVFSIGGFEVVLRQGLVRDLTGGSGYELVAFRAFGAAVLIWFCSGLGRQLSRWFWLFFGVYAGMVLILGSRTHLIMLALAMIVAYHTTGRRIPLPTALGVVAALAVGSTAYLVYRTSVIDAQVYYTSSSPFDVAAQGLPALFDAALPFDFFLIIAHLVPGFVGYDGGLTYLSTVLIPLHPFGFPLPPDPAGTLAQEILDPAGQGGRPPTFAGEGLLNFGLAGVVGEALFVGGYVRLTDWMLRNWHGRIHWLAAASFMAVGIPYFVWAVFTSWANLVVSHLVWLFLAGMLISSGERKKTRRGANAARSG